MSSRDTPRQQKTPYGACHGMEIGRASKVLSGKTIDFSAGVPGGGVDPCSLVLYNVIGLLE